ncbi:hypothetical protein BKP42_67090 [Rhodococcus erythropolis]|nr:hypothetical protein BKP42_67090 [Rhodococcus erythropolis]
MAVVQNGQEGIALWGRDSDGECAVGGVGEGCDDCGDDPVAEWCCGVVHAVVVEQDDVDSARAGCPSGGGDVGGVENRGSEGVA